MIKIKIMITGKSILESLEKKKRKEKKESFLLKHASNCTRFVSFTFQLKMSYAGTFIACYTLLFFHLFVFLYSILTVSRFVKAQTKNWMIYSIITTNGKGSRALFSI